MPRDIPSGLVTIITSAENSPVEIYELFLDQGTQRFAVSPDNIIFDGDTYTALLVRRTPIKTHTTEQVDQLSVGLDDVSLTLGPILTAQDFRGRRCRLRKVFRESLADPTHFVTLFDGFMDQPSISDSTFTIRIQSRLDLVNREYPGRVFATQCNYRHYDTACTVDPLTGGNTQTGLVVAAGSTKNRIIATAFTDVDDFWNIGRILFTSGLNINKGRQITDYDLAGTFIDIRIPFDNPIVVSDVFEVRRGCDRSVTDCVNKYNNFVNYGGFNHIPKPIIPLGPIPMGGGGKGGGIKG